MRQKRYPASGPGLTADEAAVTWKVPSARTRASPTSGVSTRHPACFRRDDRDPATFIGRIKLKPTSASHYRVAYSETFVTTTGSPRFRAWPRWTASVWSRRACVAPPGTDDGAPSSSAHATARRATSLVGRGAGGGACTRPSSNSPSPFARRCAAAERSRPWSLDCVELGVRVGVPGRVPDGSAAPAGGVPRVGVRARSLRRGGEDALRRVRRRRPGRDPPTPWRGVPSASAGRRGGDGDAPAA